MVLVSLILGTVSCEKEIKYVGDYDGDKIVLYSCAMPGKPLTVRLFRSIFTFADNKKVDPRLVGAAVSLEVGGKTYGLTEVTSDPMYKGFYVSEYVPKAGDQLVLTAQYEGLGSVRSQTVVPDPANASVKSFYMKDGIPSDKGYSEYPELHFVLEFDDPADSHDLYLISLFRRFETYHYVKNKDTGEEELVYGMVNIDVQLRSSDVLFMNGGMDVLDMGGAPVKDVEVYRIDDGSFNGTKRSFDLFISLRTFIGDHGNEFVLDTSEYTFMVTKVNEDLGKYTTSADAFFDSQRGLNKIFGEPVSVVCNVDGGIGCFGAMTVKAIPVSE